MCAALEGEAARASRADRPGPRPGRHRHRPAARREGGRRRRRDPPRGRHRVAGRASGSRPGASASPAPPASRSRRALMNARRARASRPGWRARRWCRSSSGCRRPRRAATLGVFSSHSLVELHSLMLDQTDPAEAEGTIGARLRTAWVEADAGRADGGAARASGPRARRRRALRAPDPHRRRGRADPGLGRLMPATPTI